MSIKQYESLRFMTESVVVNVGGEYVRLTFTGGGIGKTKRGGSYVTDNTAIQNALEHRSDFAKRFRLVSTTPTEREEEKKVLQDLEELKKIAPLPHLEPEVEAPKKTLADSTFDQERVLVNNAQKAKDYLIKAIPGTTYAKVQNKTMILALAAEHQITFPNWTT